MELSGARAQLCGFGSTFEAERLGWQVRVGSAVLRNSGRLRNQQSMIDNVGAKEVT